MNKPKLAKEDTVVPKDEKFNNAQAWIMSGIDMESRRIDIVGEVCEVMEALIVRALLKMSEISKEPIEMYLSTYGGDAYSGLAIYDAIRACECAVSIFAKGKIMSAGTIIFLAGDIRVAAPNTRFMIHSVSGGTEGKARDMAVDVEEAKYINNKMIEIYTERTKMKNPKFWQKKLAAHDHYFSLQEAIAYGMIKESTTEKKNVRTTRSKKR